MSKLAHSHQPTMDQIDRNRAKRDGITEFPSVDKDALLAQMAAALRDNKRELWWCREQLATLGYKSTDEGSVNRALSAADTALTAYATLSPDPVYAEAKAMLELIETVERSTRDLRVHATVAEILNERAKVILNRARGEG